MKSVLVPGTLLIALAAVAVGVIYSRTNADEMTAVINLNGKEFMIGQSPTDDILNEFIICYLSEENLRKDLEFRFSTTEQKDKYLEDNKSIMKNVDDVTDEDYADYFKGYEKNTDKLQFGGNVVSDSSQHISMLLMNSSDTPTDIYGTNIVSFLIISKEIDCSVDGFKIGQSISKSDMLNFDTRKRESGEVSYIKSDGASQIELVTLNGVIEQMIVNYLFMEGDTEYK